MPSRVRSTLKMKVIQYALIRRNMCMIIIYLANWLDEQKTLRENNILEPETLMMKRKYFYSAVKVSKK